MRKDFGAKPWTYPQAVFIIGTYDENGNADAMNAAWGGLSDTTELTLCLSSGHKTVKNILKKKEFTVSFGDADHATECDYLGLASGNSVPDKIAKAGFHIVKAEHVDAPLFEELPMALECRLKSYNAETGLLVADIINVNADERILTDGTIDLSKWTPIVFDGVNHTYRAFGPVVGKAFSDGKKIG